VIVLLFAFLSLFPLPLSAQTSKDELELDRLQNAAEEAMANNDPSGAAGFSGRAALMAVQLASAQADPHANLLFQGKADLLRSQERVYRALAMYKLGGGKPPASKGVCGMLDDGAAMSAAAVGNLSTRLEHARPAPETQAQRTQLETSAAELLKNIGAIRLDLQCY
jgi:hypothetical protein